MKRKLIKWSIAVVVFSIALCVAYEQIRSPFIEWFEGEPIIYQRTQPEPTAFELWLATPDVQHDLQLMFERHVLDEETAKLEALEAELETKKEELRAKELEAGSLQ